MTTKDDTLEVIGIWKNKRDYANKQFKSYAFYLKAEPKYYATLADIWTFYFSTLEELEMEYNKFWCENRANIDDVEKLMVLL